MFELGRIPKRLKQESENETVSYEPLADTMLIQMAFYAIPAEVYENANGEILDSSETILWEGNIMRRVWDDSCFHSSFLRWISGSNDMLF